MHHVVYQLDNRTDSNENAILNYRYRVLYCVFISCTYLYRFGTGMISDIITITVRYCSMLVLHICTMPGSLWKEHLVLDLLPGSPKLGCLVQPSGWPQSLCLTSTMPGSL